MSLLQSLPVSWWDLVDLLAVAFIVYNLLLLIRGTRAVQMLIGILILGGVYYVARLSHLPTLKAILESLLIFLPLAVIVLFQTELRRALTSFGRTPLWGLAPHQKIESTFSEIVLTATTLASRRTGGLIVVERLAGLRPYVENGIELDATVSSDLLVTLFHPETPLHDGAVIIQDGRIAAAACFLPLSTTQTLSRKHGTRHRAAIGISEETDAVAVIISEETGTISVAYDGVLNRGLDGKGLRNMLYKTLITDLGTGRGGSS